MKDQKTEAVFDRVGQRFVDYYGMMRGYIREKLVQQNLQKFLPEKPGAIIDIGGGDGRDAVWLASLGHTVTLVDPSIDMIQKAKKRAASAERDIAQRVTFFDGKSEDALRKFGSGKFDVVLSHGVLMYQAEGRTAHVDELISLAKPGGLISVLTKGRRGAIAELVLEERFDEVSELLETGNFINHLGVPAYAYEPEELVGLLEERGARTQAWFGVRIVTDQLRTPVADLDLATRKRLLAVEADFGSHASTRGLGQMLHVLTRKP